ncbi:MAG: aromatic amino acid ammonia-lyase [Deltaproteobacteria bacterium]|nr:aromatic amino acid ammonia-lyase [Deltaproteobacteria bacterium]
MIKGLTEAVVTGSQFRDVSPGEDLIELGDRPLTVDDVAGLARGDLRIRLHDHGALRERLEISSQRLQNQLEAGREVYGVTTGFGESCLNSVESQYAMDLPRNLVRFHGCGVGEPLSDEAAAATVAARLASLAAGWSAVRPEVLERLCDLLNHRILPVIPSQGSVGASGDLTPLSYVAAVLQGEREVRFQGVPMAAAEAFQQLNLEPLAFRPKESLAMMNGTSVMAGLSCLALVRARRLARFAATLTAMASDVLRGNSGHFDDRIFAAKPHPGQRACARWIREHLQSSEGGGAWNGHLPGGGETSSRIQDRYSVRCAPHVIGVLVDSLPWMSRWLETEVNGANDNPLIDPDTGDVLHGGNFYGGHCCFVADGLKNNVANIADLLERQMVLLLSPSSNNGLPENLVARTGGDRYSHHGFKAMEITASALTAEALKLTMPASVFSRSTEGHNQDKVSMGTIAARDSLRVLDLTETVAAIATLALCQGVDLRGLDSCRPRTLAMHRKVRERVKFNQGDRRQDVDIEQVLDLLRNDELPMGSWDFEV